MGDRSPAERTADRLLRYVKEPLRYGAEALHADPPWVEGEVVLKLALGHPVRGLPGARNAVLLQAAANAYVRQVLLHPKADPYQTLGLPVDASPAAVKDAFRLLIQLVHPDRQDGQSAPGEAYAAQVNRAYATLKNAGSREALDRARREAAEREKAAQQAIRAAAAADLKTTPRGRRLPPPKPILPEWLTRTVGDFVRERPATVAFATLLVVAALVVAVTRGDEESVRLTRARPADGVASRVVPDRVADAGGAAALSEAAATHVADPLRVVRDGDSGGSGRAAPLPAPPAPSQTEPTKATGAPASAPVSSAPPAIRATSASAPGPAVASALPPAPPAAAQIAGTKAATPGPAAVASPAPVAGGAAVATLPPAAGPPPAPATAKSVAAAPTPSASPKVASAPPPPVAPMPAAASSPAATPPPAVATKPAPPSPAADAVPSANVAVASLTPSVAAAAPAIAPSTAELDALFSAFVDAYDAGRLDAFVALFDDAAQTNTQRGRAAIRREYDELFKLSASRRMTISRLNWRRAGDGATARGEFAVRVQWRDGREAEQRLAIEMELARRDGKVVITRLTHQPVGP